MNIGELQVTNLRNIRSARLSPHPRLNLINGVNGSGKTSLLEALYLLSCGHSFRSREISSLVSHGETVLTVFARSTDYHSISIQKAVHIPTVAQIDGKICSTNSELANFLPCQVFYQDIFQFIDAGPVVRRSLLDWGLFHVEHNYLSLWKDYRRALKQRNALLKQRASMKQLIPWNTIMSGLAQQLDTLRCTNFNKINQLFTENALLLTDINCELHYYKGWDRKCEGKELIQIWHDSYERDVTRQFTHYGPHQADMLVVSKNFKVKHYLSRGQQKIILFALKFALAKLVSKSCIFLIDDLSSELDEIHIGKLLQYALQIDGQFFITARTGDNIMTKLVNADRQVFVLSNGKLVD